MSGSSVLFAQFRAAFSNQVFGGDNAHPAFRVAHHGFVSQFGFALHFLINRLLHRIDGVIDKFFASLQLS